MSVLIKGMEIPRRHYCHNCKVWSLCWDSKPAYNTIKSKCPLVEFAEKEDKWIPVSKQLPKVPRQCLVCYAGDTDIDVLWLDDTFESKAIIREYNIIAWMTAPEAYKGGFE